MERRSKRLFYIGVIGGLIVSNAVLNAHLPQLVLEAPNFAEGLAAVDEFSNTFKDQGLDIRPGSVELGLILLQQGDIGGNVIVGIPIAVPHAGQRIKRIGIDGAGAVGVILSAQSPEGIDVQRNVGGEAFVRDRSPRP